jgi:hypothetical protein
MKPRKRNLKIARGEPGLQQRWIEQSVTGV